VFRLAIPLAILSAIYLIARLGSRRTGRKLTIRWLPKGGADAIAQLGIFVLADLLYETVRGVAESNEAVPFENARSIVAAEKSLHIFFEQGLQEWAMNFRILIDFANFMYVNSHFVITTTALVWLYLRHNERFYFVRNMFVVAMGIALVGYTFYPTAPPRMFPEHGFVDTLNAYSDVGHDSSLAKIFINPYAAVPSMHCAFAMMIGGTGVILCRNLISKVLWALWPLLVSWVTIVTANHYWVDAALGWLVALSAALIAQRLLARARPEVWSFRVRAPREAEA
jgi:membrane-associated phospholipid phosphatase